MNPKDINYLTLQFRQKIYSKNGTEYQSFFENIMEKAFPDFQRIKPYGSKGDGGNDGYRKVSGVYYQVYAPEAPAIKQAEAAKKLKEDFENLKRNWDGISKIREYYFVFNDKYLGSTQDVEDAISYLEDQNPAIAFDKILAVNLERIFFSIDENIILGLGFDIDHRKTLTIAYQQIENIKVEIDKENVAFAFKTLKSIKKIIYDLSDKDLILEFSILEAIALNKLEETETAIVSYERIYKEYPEDPRSILYLSEIYLQFEQLEKNQELLKTAELIHNDFWLLKFQKLARLNVLGENIDIDDIDIDTISPDPRIKSNFYRFYASCFESAGEKQKADSYIQEAIRLNPNRLINYASKLDILEGRIFKCDDFQTNEKWEPLLKEILKIESQFSNDSDFGNRIKAYLGMKKFHVYLFTENFIKFEEITENVFRLILSCCFDKTIDRILTSILRVVKLPAIFFKELQRYLMDASLKKISDKLTDQLICQFNAHDSLLTEGRAFFSINAKQKYIEFLNAFENNDDEKVLAFLKDNPELAIGFATTLNKRPLLGRLIVENLPHDKNIYKDRLSLILSYSEDNFDEAFAMAQRLDFSQLTYPESMTLLEIVYKKEAWDFAILIIEKLLEKKNIPINKQALLLDLFNANVRLNRYQEIIKIGEELFENSFPQKNEEKEIREIVIWNMLAACLNREDAELANNILEKYLTFKASFDFKTKVEVEVHLLNENPNKALKAIVEGVESEKKLSQIQYAELYFLILIKIGNIIDIKFESSTEVTENSFVKLQGNSDWYYIGNSNELDAIKISDKNEKYDLFIDKKLNDKILFKNQFGSTLREEIIENILPIQKYIIWKTHHYFHKLSQDNLIKGVTAIEMTEDNGQTNFENLISFLEDQAKQTAPFFDLYCKNNYPLAMLATNEGSIVNAIGKIQNENRGFIHFSSGNINELEEQRHVVQNVIDQKLPFYIDATSAIFLTEFGIIKKVYDEFPSMKISQAALNLISELSKRFSLKPGQKGHMGYRQGKISLSEIDKTTAKSIQKKFMSARELLESKPENIGIISQVNKVDCFSEKKIHASLCDSCILAQKENLPILTDDYLYLKFNEIETQKAAPKYFSSLILVESLYKNGILKFSDYLNFFGYLSSYRLRFLPINSMIINQAIFGQGIIATVTPENLQNLNFPLTLSEEYGVSFQNAINVIGYFLIGIIEDNSIIPEVLEKIFIKLIQSFPTKLDKKTLGQILFNSVEKAIKQKQRSLVQIPNNIFANKKLKCLSQFLEIFDPKAHLVR